MQYTTAICIARNGNPTKTNETLLQWILSVKNESHFYNYNYED